MTQMLTTTHCTISTLTPVHIGCGEDYYPTNYVIKDGALHHFTAEGMINALSLTEIDQLATKAMNKGVDGLKDLQASIYARSEQLIEHASHSVPVTDALEKFYSRRVGKTAQHEGRGRRVQNILEIQRHAYNPYSHLPYIAGSGIKGAIRTALLDQLNDKHTQHFDKSRPARRDAADQLQKSLLNYKDIKSDPFRLLKVTDANYQHPEQLNGLEIRFIVNRKKQRRKKMESKGIPLQMECLAANRSKSLGFDVSFMSAIDQAIPKLTDIKQLAKACNHYYLPQLEDELRLLQELNYANPDWIKSVQNLLDGELGAAIEKQQVFLLRLGKQAGAESKTVEGQRHIKIMQGKGTPAKYQDHTTTLWLAADDKEQQNNLLPLGWVLVELPNASLPGVQQFLTDNAQADYARAAKEQQRLAEIDEKQAEKVRKEAEYAEQQRIKKEQQEQEEAKQNSMTEQQRAIYQLELEFAKVKDKAPEPQGTLRQQLTATIKQAEQWRNEDKQALLQVARTLVDFWGLKKNKKVKQQLNSLQS